MSQRTKMLGYVGLMAFGFVTGWLGRGPVDPVARATESDRTTSFDLKEPTYIKVGYDEPIYLKPYAVAVGDRTTMYGPVPESAPIGVWTIGFDDGRVKVLCTRVTALSP